VAAPLWLEQIRANPQCPPGNRAAKRARIRIVSRGSKGIDLGQVLQSLEGVGLIQPGRFAFPNPYYSPHKDLHDEFTTRVYAGNDKL
jgi:hypothetical protein